MPRENAPTPAEKEAKPKTETDEKIGYLDPQTGTIETAKDLNDLMRQNEERLENAD